MSHDESPFGVGGSTRVKYDLQRLGPFGFQDLAATLATKTLGAHVQRMGRGRDGGRDMLANGVLVWSGTDANQGEMWDGRTVFQVKHKSTLEGPKKDLAWFWREIETELKAWSKPGTERGDVPDYLVFVSNVPLTPVPGSGGFDTVNTKIRGYIDGLSNERAEDHLSRGQGASARTADRRARRDRMKRLRGWRIWDGNQIDNLVDANDDVRRAFDGFLTAGDVLKDLSALSPRLSGPELGPALEQHARWALIQERNVYFDEAGGDTRGVPIEQVAIDLPVHVPDGESKVLERVIRFVLDRGDHVMRSSLEPMPKPHHLVIAGAPGNGKTTVTRFLVQAYRAALIGENTDLADQHRKTITDTATALNHMSRTPPTHRRWPFRVDLAEFAKRKATDADYTLLNWIADALSTQVASKAVPRWELKPWLETWPSFIALDGLDEVTEPAVRKGLISDVEAFVAEAEASDCDMFVVLTTRPTGYSDEMSHDVFDRIDLADLGVEDALGYGRLVTRVRIPHDEARRQGVNNLLAEAAMDEALVHLLRTPLQVLIMSIIAETSRQFAPSRFNLFWGYYQIVEQREKAKTLAFSSLLRDHAPQVLDLHRRVGLLLQKHAESAAGATAVLSPEELKDVAWQVLTDADYDPSTTDARLLDQIFTAVTHRLVMLVPRGDEGYGFDVRSLQELMAALELTTGTIEEALVRLREIAASPHWRNTLLFALGRYFSEPQPTQQKAVTDLVLTIDVGAYERLGDICPVGPELAWEIVDDGMTRAIPKWHNKFVSHGLTILYGPEPRDLSAFTGVLVRAATLSPAALNLIRDGLRAALGGPLMVRRTAEHIQERIRLMAMEMTIDPDVYGLTKVARDISKQLPNNPTTDWASFDETISVLADDSTRSVLEIASTAIHRLARGANIEDDWDPLGDILTSLQVRPEMGEVLQEALGHIAGGQPHIVALLRDLVIPTLGRRPTNITLAD
jgi:hypothetical protein